MRSSGTRIPPASKRPLGRSSLPRADHIKSARNDGPVTKGNRVQPTYDPRDQRTKRGRHERRTNQGDKCRLVRKDNRCTNGESGHEPSRRPGDNHSDSATADARRIDRLELSWHDAHVVAEADISEVAHGARRPRHRLVGSHPLAMRFVADRYARVIRRMCVHGA